MRTISLTIAFVALIITINQYSYDYLLTVIALRVPRNSKLVNQLQELGRTTENDYLDFRIAQVLYVIVAEIFLLALSIASILSFGQLLVGLLVTPLAVILITQMRLKEKLDQRKKAMSSEFPVVVEVLTLSIGAGESPLSAMARLASRAHGYLADEFRRVVNEASQGKPMIFALDDLSRRVNSLQVSRFVDALVIAMSRGTPLIQTLSSQAMEARSSERNYLLKAAGKSEVSMMIPVVFLILPVSILFALYPSLTSLDLFGDL